MAQRNRAGGRVPARTLHAGRGTGRTVEITAVGPAAGHTDLAAHRTRLRAVVAPVVAHAGYDLEELAVTRAGRRHLLRVVVDGDGGVDLDTIADLSRDISVALDEAERHGGEFATGEYVLEVSSPGVDRPLTEPRHWRRSVGRLVTVRAGDAQVTGRVVDADAGQVILDVAGDRRAFTYDRLGPGRVQIEFSRLDEVGEDVTSDDVMDEPADFDEREEDGE